MTDRELLARLLPLAEFGVKQIALRALANGDPILDKNMQLALSYLVEARRALGLPTPGGGMTAGPVMTARCVGCQGVGDLDEGGLCVACYDAKVDRDVEYQRRYYEEYKAEAAERRRRYYQEHKAGRRSAGVGTVRSTRRRRRSTSVGTVRSTRPGVGHDAARAVAVLGNGCLPEQALAALRLLGE